ncbi:MAG: hypothetical protein JXR03_05990 [Cyclobacteriaceae bacterium]
MLAEGYKYFRWLSLDIVLGAIIFLAFLGSYYDTSFSFSIYFSLASAIWLIYTTDHLIDSAKAADSARRKFHKDNFKGLVFIGGVVLLLALVNVYFLPHDIIKNGAILSSMCIGYLLLVYFIRALWFKEILVAFGYGAGVFLVPVTENGAITALDLIFLLQLVLIALINLLVFSYYDMEEDSKVGFSSIAKQVGAKKARLLINSLILLSLIASAFILLTTEAALSFEVVYLSMTIILAVTFWMPYYFRVKERYRALGDAVFYMPLIFLL